MRQKNGQDRIVEIIVMEQNKEKRMKKNEDSLRASGTTFNAPTCTL